MRLLRCPGLINVASYVIALLAVSGLFVMTRLDPPFSPDSWSYYELSQSVFGDFFRIATYRQYEFTQPYGASFPPLYPVLLGAVRQVWDPGIYTGYLLNYLICLLTLPALVGVARALHLPGFLGSIFFLSLLVNQGYRIEALAARTMPLSVLLIVLVFLILVKTGAQTWKSCALVGVLAGLAVMNRFDFLPSALVLGLLAPGLSAERGSGFKKLLGYFASLALTVSPWVVYSHTHFGKPFVTDNSRTGMLAHRSHTLEFFAERSDMVLATDQPLTWALTLCDKLWGCGRALLESLAYDSIVMQLAVLLLAVLLLGASRGAGDGLASIPPEVARILLAFLVILGVQFLAVSLAGYPERRYFVATTLFLTIGFTYLVAGVVGSWPAGSFQSAWLKRAAVALALLFLVPVFLLAVAEARSGRARVALRPLFNARFMDTSEYGELSAALGEYPGRPRVLLLSGPFQPHRFGALTGWETVCRPYNVTETNVIPLIRRFQVTHVYDPDGEFVAALGSSVVLKPLSPQGLYEITSAASRTP